MMRLKLFSICLLSGFFIICNSSCKKDNVQGPEEKPSAQNIEFYITYSGTAKANIVNFTHKLFIVIESNNKTLSNSISLDIQGDYELRTGKSFISHAKFNPGLYKISGFLDWNYSETWEEYEPYIAPVTLDLIGFEVPKVNIYVVDKSYPTDDGWAEGIISYNGSKTGNHNVFLDISGVGDATPYFYLKITDTPVNLNVQNITYKTSSLPSKETYQLIVFWDLNDNSIFDYEENEPYTLETLYISPGLPERINFEVH